ncbi:pseudouridine-5'-phosphate glycosidase [Cupriavidus necator]|nr:pseudouridine-5'-phosphate glycosidase [Cupriavidus necator]
MRSRPPRDSQFCWAYHSLYWTYQNFYFYGRNLNSIYDSGFRADFRLDDAAQQARFIRTKWELGLAGGVVLSTPVPEAAAMASDEIDVLTQQALADAMAQGITGKAVAPFLLA